MPTAAHASFNAHCHKTASRIADDNVHLWEEQARALPSPIRTCSESKLISPPQVHRNYEMRRQPTKDAARCTAGCRTDAHGWNNLKQQLF